MSPLATDVSGYGPVERGSARTGAVAMACVVGFWSLPLFALLFVIPKFEEIFKDFGVQLPDTALWLIGASRWVRGDQVGQVIPGLVFVAPVFLVFLGAAVVLVLRERSGLVLLGLVLLPILFLAMTIYAMFVPLVAMIESLQGGGAP